MVVFAIMSEYVAGPGLDDHIQGLFKSGSAFTHRDAIGEVLPWNAAHKASDHTPSGQVVQHGQLLGNAERMTMERKKIPCHGELEAFGLGGDVGQK
jgi:hypothetical protein